MSGDPFETAVRAAAAEYIRLTLPDLHGVDATIARDDLAHILSRHLRPLWERQEERARADILGLERMISCEGPADEA